MPTQEALRVDRFESLSTYALREQIEKLVKTRPNPQDPLWAEMRSRPQLRGRVRGILKGIRREQSGRDSEMRSRWAADALTLLQSDAPTSEHSRAPERGASGCAQDRRSRPDQAETQPATDAAPGGTLPKPESDPSTPVAESHQSSPRRTTPPSPPGNPLFQAPQG